MNFHIIYNLIYIYHINAYLNEEDLQHNMFHYEDEETRCNPNLWQENMDIGSPNKPFTKYGTTMWNGEHTNKLCTCKEPTFSLWCRNGQVDLDKEPPPLEPFASSL